MNNTVAAILENFDVAEDVLTKSAGAAGSAMEENEKYLNSIQGKVEQLTASFQALSQSILSNELVKVVIDLATKSIDFINKVNEKNGEMISKIFDTGVAIASIIVAINLLKSGFNYLHISAIKDLASITGAITTLGAKIFTLTTGVKVESMALKASLETLFPWLIAIGAAIGIAVFAYKQWRAAHPTTEDLRKSAEETNQELNDVQNKLEAISLQIDAINAKEIKDITDEEELKRLGLENDELERRARILAAEKEAKDADLNRSTLADIAEAEGASTSRKRKFHRGGQVYEVDSINKNAVSLTNLNSRIDKIEELRIELERTEKSYDEFIENGGKTDSDEGKELREKISSIGDQIKNATKSAGEMREKVEALYDNLTGDSPEVTKALEEESKVLIRYANVLGQYNTKGDINSVINYSDFDKLRESLKNLNDQGKLTGEMLQTIYNTEMAEGKGELYEFVQLLVELGVIKFDGTVEQFELIKNAIFEAKEEAKDLLDVGVAYDTADNLKGISSALKSAMSDYKSYRNLTSETISAIKQTAPEFLDFLYDEEGHLTETGIAALQYADDFKEAGDATAYLQKIVAKTSLQKVISQLNAEGIAWDDNTEKMKKNIMTRMAFYSAQAAEVRNNALALYGSDAIGSRLANKEAETAFANVTALQNALTKIDEYEKDYSNWSPIGGRTGDSSGSKTDLNKKKAEDERKKLKHQLEMERITLQEYYDGISKIREEYYSEGKEAWARKEYGDPNIDYSEERLDIEEEVFQGRLEILEDFINDSNRLAERYSNVGNIEQQEQVYKDVLSRINSEIEKALAEGYDENDEFVQKLRDLYKEAADNIVNTMMDAYDDYIKYVDDFDLWRNLDFTKADVLKSQMNELKRLYSQDLISWKDYVDKHNEIGETLYDTYKSSIDEIINLTMEMIQQEADDQIEALEKSEKKYQDILDLKKKILQATKDQVDHELEVEDAVRSLSKLQSKYNQLLLDDSREAAAKRAELEEQIFQAQRSLTQLQADYSTEKTIEALDEQGDAYSKTVDAETQLIEKGVDTWVKRYNKAIELINSDWNGLYSKLEQYQLKHRNSIDGMDSLKTAWDNANDAAKTYMGTMNNIINLRNTIGNEIGISPYDADVDANGLVALSGRGGATVSSGAINIIQRMYDRSKKWYGKSENEQTQMANESVKDGNQLKSVYGMDVSRDKNGVWWYGNKKLFEWAISQGLIYHNGGAIGGKYSQAGKEIMAVVKTGELTLNEEQQKNLAKILSGPNKALMSLLGTYTMKPTGIPGIGETFAPNIEVNVTATPGTRDSDARRYGEIAADAALDRLYDAFKRRGK